MSFRSQFLLPVILSLFFCSCGNNQPHGLYHQVLKQAGLPESKKLLVVVFIHPECPITQKYTRTLNALSDSMSQNVSFVGIIPGKLFDNKSIADFKQQFAFNPPIIKDEQYAITRALKATVFPEVVVLNQQSARLYSGKIDNWYESPGNYRAEPTEFYLKDAITSYLQKGAVVLNSTEPVGCFINYKND